jgi:hypothetical protein
MQIETEPIPFIEAVPSREREHHVRIVSIAPSLDESRRAGVQSEPIGIE